MIVILNLLWILVLAVSALAAYKIKKPWPVVVGIVVVALYMQFQPSYSPKGVVTRQALPAFEASDAKIQNHLLMPKSGEEYDAKRQADIEKGLPFIEK